MTEPPTRRYRVGRARALALTVGTALAWALVPGGTAIAAPENEPVVLVHGYYYFARGPSATWKNMEVMATRFRDAGFPATTVHLDSNDNITNAYLIRDAVDAARAGDPNRKVHIVAHSMGAVSARYYLNVLDGGTNLVKVRSYTSIGGANYGAPALCSAAAYPSGSPAFGQACPTGPRSLLPAINAGDDTPGDISYTTLWSSTGDKKANVELKGGACFASFDGVRHPDEPTNEHVFQLALHAVQGQCPGTFEDHQPDE